MSGRAREHDVPMPHQIGIAGRKRRKTIHVKLDPSNTGRKPRYTAQIQGDHESGSGATRSDAVDALLSRLKTLRLPSRRGDYEIAHDDD